MAKKIILLCAGGGHPDWQIAAYPQADAKEQAADASCILLGPQIRFAKDKVAAVCPGVPIDAIDMKIYGRMDGKGAIDIAKKLMGV